MCRADSEVYRISVAATSFIAKSTVITRWHVPQESPDSALIFLSASVLIQYFSDLPFASSILHADGLSLHSSSKTIICPSLNNRWHSKIFTWPWTAFPNTCSSITTVSVSAVPSFIRKFMQNWCSLRDSILKKCADWRRLTLTCFRVLWSILRLNEHKKSFQGWV